MKAYRYLPKQFAKLAVEQGVLRLSTSAAVARLESGLADTMDCAVEMRGNLHVANPFDGSKEAQLLRRLITIEGSAGRVENISLVNTTFRTQSRSWLLCCTSRADNSYLLRESPGNDAVIEIADMEQLAIRLTEAHSALRDCVRAPVAPGRTRFAIGRVEYAQRRLDRFEDIEADPFIKEVRFSREEEIRAVWLPPAQIIEPLIVRAPAIRELIRIV